MVRSRRKAVFTTYFEHRWSSNLFPIPLPVIYVCTFHTPLEAVAEEDTATLSQRAVGGLGE